MKISFPLPMEMEDLTEYKSDTADVSSQVLSVHAKPCPIHAELS
jgi:hypothetical protein